MSWAGFLFDSLVIWFLLWRRSRPYAYLTVLLFHGVTSALFPIGMFPVIMVLGALVFFPPDWPRGLLRRFNGRTGQRTVAATPRLQISRPALSLLALYCLLQVAWPLRFLAYKLELDDRQVTELARILNELKTERAQAEVDRRRTVAAFADAMAGATYDATRAAEGGGRPSLEWREYRQALRDITKQADPASVVWPTPPAGENS